jgi:hypothetical protein
MVGFASKKAMAESRWTAILEEDGEDLILPLPEELLEELDWHVGDTLQWTEHSEGSWSIRKKV